MDKVELTLREYERRVLFIADDRNWEEVDVWEALICRDHLEDVTASLNREQRQRLADTDDRLLALHQRAGQALPGRGEIPRSHWWWFLHEGPQVREQAREAA